MGLGEECVSPVRRTGSADGHRKDTVCRRTPTRERMTEAAMNCIETGREGGRGMDWCVSESKLT